MSDYEIGEDKPEFIKTKYGGITTTGTIRESLFDIDAGVEELLNKKTGSSRFKYTLMSDQDKVLNRISILCLKYKIFFKNEIDNENEIIEIKSIVNKIPNIIMRNPEALMFSIKLYNIFRTNLTSFETNKNKMINIQNNCDELFNIAIKENVPNLDIIRYYRYLEINKLIQKINVEKELALKLKFKTILEKADEE